ncbi:MAG: C-GCAxxG-C-C family protein [Spirochaetota bacterium]
MEQENIILQQQAKEYARSFFLRDDTRYGCAESAFIALKSIYELPEPDVSSEAMAFNGGIAYSGGMCGALTGAAMALGLLAEQRCSDHKRAKKLAREALLKVRSEFHSEFGSDQCSDLISYDISIPSEHDRFIESGEWKSSCMRQIEFVVTRLAVLKRQYAWDEFASELA